MKVHNASHANRELRDQEIGQLKQKQDAALPKVDQQVQKKDALRKQLQNLNMQLRFLENETANEELLVQNLRRVHDIEKELREKRTIRHSEVLAQLTGHISSSIEQTNSFKKAAAADKLEIELQKKDLVHNMTVKHKNAEKDLLFSITA